MNKTKLIAPAIILSALLSPLTAQEQREDRPTTAGIAWFGTWEQGAAEARRTGRPILLISAAPQCHEVSGIW